MPKSINNLIGVLSERGFKKEASEISTLKNDIINSILDREASNSSSERISKKLSYIYNKLDGLGYTILVDKLGNDINEYTKMNSVCANEMHEIPSVEKVYENSKTIDDFKVKLRKLIGIHEKILNVLKMFETEYNNRVVDKIEDGRIHEKETIDKIINIVTEVDSKINTEIKRMDLKNE